MTRQELRERVARAICEAKTPEPIDDFYHFRRGHYEGFVIYGDDAFLYGPRLRALLDECRAVRKVK